MTTSDTPDYGPSPLRGSYPAWWRYYTVIAAYTQQTTTKRLYCAPRVAMSVRGA